MNRLGDDLAAVQARRVTNVLGEERCDDCGALWTDLAHEVGRPGGETWTCLTGVAVRVGGEIEAQVANERERCARLVERSVAAEVARINAGADPGMTPAMAEVAERWCLALAAEIRAGVAAQEGPPG